MDADSAWSQPGFRVQLRFGFERVEAMSSEAPEMSAVAINVEPGIRLSRLWSVAAGLRYSILLGSWDGLRWSTTADATLHPTSVSYITVGAGYGGLVAQKAKPYVDQRGFAFQPDEPAGASRLTRCSGDGGVGVLRAGFSMPIGELFATGPSLQADLQATRCSDPRSRLGLADEWWWHRSIHFAWALAWR